MEHLLQIFSSCNKCTGIKICFCNRFTGKLEKHTKQFLHKRNLKPTKSLNIKYNSVSALHKLHENLLMNLELNEFNEMRWPHKNQMHRTSKSYNPLRRTTTPQLPVLVNLIPSVHPVKPSLGLVLDQH